MKQIYFIATIFMITVFTANAQLVTCRPRLCLIDYNYHNDNQPNADMTAIKNARPDILIDNTPGGYWGQQNGGTGCLPAQYTPLGIQVFSYITSGYEGTKYGTSEDNLQANLARVNAIATDGATGVFLDEVTAYPSPTAQLYIDSIYSRCQAKGLQLILNPGTKNFDAWLMSHCDYLMSDEQYDGQRSPTPSEAPYVDRLLVVTEHIINANDADTITLGARRHGFGYSYACNAYTSLPSWLGTYVSQIVQTPPAPVISLNGSTLQSNAPYGNLWYGANGAIGGATIATYVPLTGGYYYTIVTLDNCSSDTSNKIYFNAGIRSGQNNQQVQIYPNPAADYLIIDANPVQPTEIKIYSIMGEVVHTETIQTSSQRVDLKSLNNSVYTILLQSGSIAEYHTLVIQK